MKSIIEQELDKLSFKSSNTIKIYVKGAIQNAVKEAEKRIDYSERMTSQGKIHLITTEQAKQTIKEVFG